MHFLLNRWKKQLKTLQVDRSYDVEDTGQCFVCVLGLKSMLKGEIIYFLVNAPPPNR